MNTNTGRTLGSFSRGAQNEVLTSRVSVQDILFASITYFIQRYGSVLNWDLDICLKETEALGHFMLNATPIIDNVIELSGTQGGIVQRPNQQQTRAA